MDSNKSPRRDSSGECDGRDVYRAALLALQAANIEFLLGGAFALTAYTGLGRWTKDLDLVVRRADLPRTLHVLTEAGFDTTIPFPHWLAKARRGPIFVDVLFSSGNGVTEVDDDWFVHARPHECFGVSVGLCPPEELLWSKAFVMERERYDGADVAHLLHAQGPSLDWDRVLARFEPWWRVLLSHLLLFDFIYPDDRERVPRDVVDTLLARAMDEPGSPAEHGGICFGTLVSREQYLHDIEQLGYRDARVEFGLVAPEELQAWNEAIGREQDSPAGDAATHSSGAA